MRPRQKPRAIDGRGIVRDAVGVEEAEGYRFGEEGSALGSHLYCVDPTVKSI